MDDWWGHDPFCVPRARFSWLLRRLLLTLKGEMLFISPFFFAMIAELLQIF